MRKLFIVFILLGFTLAAMATHQRAGEITFRWKGGLTYEFTILTYTYAPSPADRPSLDLNFGDGQIGTISRVEKVDLPNQIRRNKYIGDHTYSGVGSYIVSLEDPNRNGGILNIPNSVNVPLFIETLLVINPFFTANNSPELLLPPIDMGCTNYPYIHNPGAWDPDGDSLSYRLVDCRGAGGLPIGGYVLPNKTSGNNIPPDTVCSINPLTGEFLWNYPKINGEYNIAILIEEWRKGIRIGYVTRDMQIIIMACTNHPPVIKAPPDTCVIAGSSINFDVEASDPDGQIVTLSGTGGPLVMPISPASFPTTSNQGTVVSHFSWNTVCDHVQKYPHTVYFKAQDNGYPVNLVNVVMVNLSVIAPRIENLNALPFGNSIILHWDPSKCANAIGYRIYRRNGFYGYVPGYCETGVPAYTGYQKIATINDLSTLSFTDDDNGSGLIHGVDYCYMVIAFFDDGAESIASSEVCVSLKRDLPIITNISIRNTDPIQGSVFVAWVKPTELDFTQTPGPFKYLISRDTPPGTGWVLIDSLSNLTDTSFVDSLVNTRDNKIDYEIGLVNDTPGNRFLIGYTHLASSVFLNLLPSDHKIILKWSCFVPWTNDTMVVYRQNPVSLLYDSIGNSKNSMFVDSNLVNGKYYCYYVKGIGSYSDPVLPYPLINYSQRTCAKPMDNVPPCPPIMAATVNCATNTNTLVWTNPNQFCTSDTYKYYIYFKAESGSDFVLLDSVFGAENTTYTHQQANTIVGCYAVTAFDTVGNQSVYSVQVCIEGDSCPDYTLPNVFTPNGDNKNDVFKPFPYNSVSQINLTIYNRWGVVVFQTMDPDINWDGYDKNSHQLCSGGVYFYVCDVFEIRLKGLYKRSLHGIVTLIY
ncbi:MAG: gliding motility-associated C-terminal domain-containing protein [Bacteroidota bacterium]